MIALPAIYLILQRYILTSDRADCCYSGPDRIGSLRSARRYGTCLPIKISITQDLIYISIYRFLYSFVILYESLTLPLEDSYIWAVLLKSVAKKWRVISIENALRNQDIAGRNR